MKDENRRDNRSGSRHESGARVRDLRVPPPSEQRVKAGIVDVYARPRDIIGEARNGSEKEIDRTAVLLAQPI
jgi:hypothetical protein